MSLKFGKNSINDRLNLYLRGFKLMKITHGHRPELEENLQLEEIEEEIHWTEINVINDKKDYNKEKVLKKKFAIIGNKF